MSLLAVRTSQGEPALPWAKLVRKDLCELYEHVGECRLKLRSPDADPTEWYDFTKSSPTESSNLVKQMSYSASIGDAFSEEASGSPVTLHVCEVCTSRPSFKSNKGMLSHLRVVHGSRNCMRLYADANGICNSCKAMFRTRLRLLAHLCDSRRPTCHEFVLQHCSPMPKDRARELDDQDRLLRAAARKSGHTQQSPQPLR